MTTKNPRLRPGRLLKLATFLESLPDQKFDFSLIATTVPGCGTVACAVGWTPRVFPKLVRWRRNRIGVYAVALRCPTKKQIEEGCDEDLGAARVLFGLTEREARFLFVPRDSRYPQWNTRPLGEQATAKEVAQGIRNFVEYRSTHRGRVVDGLLTSTLVYA